MLNNCHGHYKSAALSRQFSFQRRFSDHILVWVLTGYSVKQEISCSALKLDEWTSVKYSETIWNLDSYSHNAEESNLKSSEQLIFNFLKWLRTIHTELLCINGFPLESISLQGSPETIWHIIVER